jgi:hypothetical protein
MPGPLAHLRVVDLTDVRGARSRRASSATSGPTS